MKTYTFNDFKPNDYAYKTITEKGRFSVYSGRYEINYSGILSTLIGEAGRFCEAFASDLFIDWSFVVDYIKNASENARMSYLFGFRQYGVDHAEYVLNRYNNEQGYAKHNYRSLWRLDVVTEGKEIKMTLGRVF